MYFKADSLEVEKRKNSIFTLESIKDQSWVLWNFLLRIYISSLNFHGKASFSKM